MLKETGKRHIFLLSSVKTDQVFLFSVSKTSKKRVGSLNVPKPLSAQISVVDVQMSSALNRLDDFYLHTRGI